MALQLLWVFVLFYFQSVSSLSIAPQSQNAVRRYGYKPEPSCDNLFPVETSITEGYFCIENYVRDANDQCIFVYDCPQFKIETTTLPTCPAGESYRTELYPEPSCDDLYPEAKGIKEGCYCDDHAVRNPQGKCVSVYECLQYISTTTTTAATPVCPAGEYYTAGLYPEPTCENFFPDDVFIKEGCFCPEDFVRDSTGKCVNYLTCPQIVTTTTQTTTICPAGEELRVDLYPEPSCSKLFPEYGNLKEGCFCINDNVRDSAGKCISIPECPQFATPASPSVPNYDDDVYSPRSSLPTLKCIPGSTFKVDCNNCICNAEGTSAQCTRKACLPEVVTAPPMTCPAGEVWGDGLYPEPSCDNFYPENVYVKEGCFCQENYIRNSDGKCVEIGQCDFLTEPQPTETPDVITYECFKCIPGTSFNVDCNVCTCAQDGKSTICTKYDCELTDYSVRSGPTCPQGEIFSKGMYPEATCDDFFPDYSEIKEGCFCAPGLVRNSDGKCVSMYDCAKYTSTTSAPPSEEIECCPGMATYSPCSVCICNEDGKSETCYDIPCSGPGEY